jgi:hypothetical protein
LPQGICFLLGNETPLRPAGKPAGSFFACLCLTIDKD